MSHPGPSVPPPPWGYYGAQIPPVSPIGGWEVVSLGDGFYWIYPRAPITATGAAVESKLYFDFPFKLIAILLEHCVAAGTLGTDALTWSFGIKPRTGLKNNFPIVSYTASAVSQFLEIFGDNYIFPAGHYYFSQNTTNTDLINVSFIIQERKI